MIYINGKFLTQKLTGSQRFAYEMTRELFKIYGYNNVCVLVPQVQLNDSYKINDFQIKPIGKFKSIVWEQVDLPIFLTKNGIPLLVNFVNTAPLFYKNQLVSILDMTVFINPTWFSKAFYYYYKMVWPIISKMAKRIITISECSKNDISRLLNVAPEKIDIVYCGVANQFTKGNNSTHENNQIIKRLSLNKDGFFLAVSSLEPRKNFVKLVKAYNDIKTSIAPLVIVGSEGKVFANDELRELINNSKNIILTGYVRDDDLACLYNNAYCFIYPSLYEGFGMPPLEAMSCNCATITANTASLPEVCGNASLYVDPESIDSIKNGIITLYNDNKFRQELIANGKEQCLKFSWDRSGKILRKVIDAELQQN